MRAKILNASAGSGKTYQLAYKYVRDVVSEPAIYRHILAVTFTNKATEEMKSRILKEIHTLASNGESSFLAQLCDELSLDAHTVRQRARDVRSRILHDYSRFTVLTIDTFFQRILRAFIKELGIDLNYNVEIETSSVLAKSADTLIDQITTDDELRLWLTEFVQERIDEGRRWDIRDGILSLGGELFKEKNKEALTSARSREDLATIVAQLTAEAERTQAMLRDLAQKAVQIIGTAGLTPADFSGKSRSFAHYFFTIAAGEVKAPGVTVVKMAATTDGWAAKGSTAATLATELQPLLREMCDLYDGNIRAWNTRDLLRENYRSFALLADLYARVQQMCDEQNMMLLSETKYILSAFVRDNDAPFIYEKVGNRFDRFMIDEFQDTSAKEWENFLPLLQNAMSQTQETSVVIVGDIKQSIYRWRGGDWKILHSGAQEALGEDTEVVNLKDNYRSLPVIVAFNNNIIERIVTTDNLALNTTLSEASERGDIPTAEALRLRNTLADAYCNHAQNPKRRGETMGYVSVETFAETPPVVGRLCELIDKGFRPCDILILVRGATDAGKVAAELLEFKRSNKDPRYRFDVMTQEALVVGNATISSFVAAALRLSLNPDDSLSRAVYNHYLHQPFDQPLDDDQRAFFRSLRLRSPEEAFEQIVIRHTLDRDTSQIAYLQAIHEQIIAFTANKVADIPLFLRWWEEQGQNRSLSIEQSDTTVEITTIHKAKGLEKRAVLIPYCSWQLDPKSGGGVQNIVWAEAPEQGAVPLGRFPVKYKKAMAESAFSAEYYREMVYSHVDNINLLYVALTRAAESLHIFIPSRGAKSVGGVMIQSLAPDGDKITMGDLTGRYTTSEAGERYEFGEFTSPIHEAPKRTAEHLTLTTYPTSLPELRLRLPAQRYFEQQEEVVLSPRNMGIMLHKAFEQAERADDIHLSVEGMLTDGLLSPAEAEQLRGMVTTALSDPRVAEWFGDGWQRIRNENDIVIPGGGTTRRPDRVMVAGKRAVVVDYKFGELEAAKYRRQIAEYLELLRQMGYTQVEGYIWYVKLGTIEKIESQ